MKAWCPTCEAPRRAKAFSRNPHDWTCGECGSLLRAMPRERKPVPARPRKALARGRSTKPVMRPEVREAMVAWARADVCAVCRDPECRPVLGHHVLHQEKLISRAATLRIDPVPLLEDRRGWLRVGDACHQQHHKALPRIPLSVLRAHCPDVFAFAAELGLSLWLEQFYPDIERTAA